MEDWIDSIPPDVRASSFDLHAQHLDTTVFPLAMGPVVILRLREAGRTILGGDFWKRSPDGRFMPSYENWYVERHASESEDEYRERSYLTASDAIQQPWVADLWVSFVCD